MNTTRLVIKKDKEKQKPLNSSKDHFEKFSNSSTSQYSEYIDKNFPYPSYSNIPNKLVYPGDWNFDKKTVLERISTIEENMTLKDYEAGLNVELIKSLPSPVAIIPHETEEFCWREISSSGAESKEGASIVKIGSSLVLFGGQNRVKNKQVCSFNMNTLEWKIIPTLYAPKGRLGHTAVDYKQKMIVYGGSSEYSSRFGQRHCDKKVYILSMKSLKWQVFEGTGQVPKARRNHCCTRIGKTMIICGGIDKYSRNLASCHIFDIKTHVWKYFPGPVEVSHCSLTAVYPLSVLNSYTADIFDLPTIGYSKILKPGLYLYGGLQNGKVSGSLWLMPSSKQQFWEKLETAGLKPIARYNHTAGFIAGYLIIFGGRNDDLFSTSQELISDIGLLSVEKLLWEKIPLAGDIPKPRWGHCCCPYEKKLIIFGGMDYKQYMPSSLFYLTFQVKNENKWFWIVNWLIII